MILMGMSRLGQNMERLMDGGLAPTTPVAVIRNGSRPEQRSLLATAATIERRCRVEDIASPAVVVVGSVASLHDVLGSLR